ncbi:hypothetical protein, partial [Bacillus altitudinis]|uniref:hypothetical protein n=1 Tax=Bacillus altitudinis TaxID=293387 RepID=UPI001C92E8ED
WAKLGNGWILEKEFDMEVGGGLGECGWDLDGFNGMWGKEEEVVVNRELAEGKEMLGNGGKEWLEFMCWGLVW